MANTTALQKNQSARALQKCLNSADWHNSFLVRVGRMEITPTEITTDRVTARQNNVPLRQLDQASAIVNIAAYLQKAFQYLAADLDGEMAKMIVSDILDLYEWMSPLEVVKAINEGRQNCGELYGKLSGRHVLQWVQDYDVKMQQDLARHHQNAKHDDGLTVEDVLVAYKRHTGNDDSRRELSHQEKVKALQHRYQTIDEDERRRREYSRAWSLEKHGDYQQYMANYNEKKE